MRTIGKGDQRDGDLTEALQILNRHGTLASTRADALAWAEKAKAALCALPAHDLRDMLADLTDYVVARLK